MVHLADIKFGDLEGNQTGGHLVWRISLFIIEINLDLRENNSIGGDFNLAVRAKFANLLN